MTERSGTEPRDSQRKRFSRKELERLRGEKLSKREAMTLLGGPGVPRFIPPTN